MTKVDLHVHSKYSDYPSTWGHKAYNSPESFTSVEAVYEQAKRRGMDFVTLTDHDDIRGSLELVEKFPSDSFISCEITTFFPEDDCKIHVLVYGIDQQQYDQIMHVRASIYDLRNYIVNENIAYSVAHATYDQDGKLNFGHIEKLVILFDVFEIINGGCDSQNNILLHQYLQSLDPQLLDSLQSKHQLEPISDTPWVKGFTGGSDDHCGILIGTTFTQSAGHSLEQFLQSIRDKKSQGNGMHGSFESYATGVIKHIHDYRNDRDPKYIDTKMSDFLSLFFESQQGNLIKRFKKSQSLRYLKKKNSKTHKALHSLLQQISQDAGADISSKIPQTYLRINELHDEMFRSVVGAFAKHLPSGDVFKGFQKLVTLFPMALLALPFIGSIRHQMLRSDFKRKLIEGTKQQYTEKALWFTDTIDDLNGVSVTLRQIANHSQKHNYQLTLVTCVDETRISSPLPVNTLNFPPIKETAIPGYETQSIGFPSLLTMLRKISLEQADQIIISTPGPLGLGAMLCAKLMDLPVKTIFHTDFSEQVMRITNEPSLARLTDYCVNAFYAQSDRIFVPSQFYINKLSAAGLERDKLSIFPRGLDLDAYQYRKSDASLTQLHTLNGDFTLLFAGRISKDKNLALLVNLIRQAEQQTPGNLNMIIAGDGPDLDNLKSAIDGLSNVHFTGRVTPSALIEWYLEADLLVFPSHTDTFGMVVLEAQACGVPCLVTDTGGPKEIIDIGVTGKVIDSDAPGLWLQAVEEYRQMKLQDPAGFIGLKQRCAEHVHTQNNWQPVFEAVLGKQCLLPTPNDTVTHLPKQHKAA